MVKSMPKYVLPRNHEKHPSGFHALLPARKLINRQLETVKGRLRDLYASEDNVKNAVLSQFEWLDKSATKTSKRLPHFARSLHNAMAIPMKSFVVLRCLQQEINHLRKTLSVVDATRICCCRKDHFIQEIGALGDMMKLYLMEALRRSDVCIDTGSVCDLHRSEGGFWSAVQKIDKHELLEKDKLLSIAVDILQSSCCVEDQYDTFAALTEHLADNNSEMDRFEPTRLITLTEHITLFRHLKECSDVLSGGKVCGRRGDCDVGYCGLHGFLEGMAPGGPRIFETREFNFAKLTATVASRFLYGSQKAVSSSQLWDAMVRYAEAACALHSISINNEVKWPQTNGKHQIHRLRCNPHGLVHAGNVLRELFQFLRTTSHTTSIYGQKAKAQNKLSVSSQTNDASETCSTKVATEHCKAVVSGSHLSDSYCHPSASEARVKAVSQARTAVEPLPPARKDVSFNIATNIGSHRNQQEGASITPRARILSKYHSRGYGNADRHIRQPKHTAATNIYQRTWIVSNPTFYHEVWRVIFPLTKEDRLVSRVSWRLFQQAIESPPLNCHLKKAQGSVFIWERGNGRGGDDIFQCHAPHSFDWIRAGDLYRYRKDLRDTFGMDTERIRLEGKTYQGKRRACGAKC